MNDYGKLKSGTDIRGVAIASEEKPALLTEQAVADFAGAFALWLQRRTGKARCKIAIGRDSRLTGELFQKTIIDKLKYCSLELFDCGMFSTPAAFMTTKLPSMQADGAIMITASHHPKDINGLKFFTADGGVNSAELDEIIELADAGECVKPGSLSMIIRRDYMRLYCDTLCDMIRKGTGLFMPLKGMKIVVDAGHGAGGFFADRVLSPLGADVSASQFLQPDGAFPAHPPNPENAEAMESLKTRVVESGADIGIIFDADVDRCAVVTGDGTEVNRCRLIALAAAMILPEHKGATIVTDSVTTEGLRKFIEAHGGVQKRFRRGYRNVIDEAKRLCDAGTDAPLAIESSGHVAFKEHYFLDDGAYFVAKILVTFANLRRKGKDLVDLIDGLETPLEECDVRLKMTGRDWKATAEKIISRLNGIAERMLRISEDNYEGVRAYVSHADGYFIVRTSVHDPVVPIYIESNKRGGALSIARFLYSYMCGFSGVDMSPLQQLIDEKTIELEIEKSDDDGYDDLAQGEEAAVFDVGEGTNDFDGFDEIEESEQAEQDDFNEDTTDADFGGFDADDGYAVDGEADFDETNPISEQTGEDPDQF
ncbi:MAG: phosphomannomutase/phosphoglucomutase [Clostridia bacterium]|nr:phosphomannomutase/phosphoglucomutase [Clostridia bacterium]